MALFRFPGSWHTWKEPSSFLGYVREGTDSVGQVTGVMTLSMTMLLSLLYAVSLFNRVPSTGHAGQGEWVSMDGVDAWHVFYGIKGEREGMLEG